MDSMLESLDEQSRGDWFQLAGRIQKHMFVSSSFDNTKAGESALAW